MSAQGGRTGRAKHVFFAIFGLLTLFVLYYYELPLLDSSSPARQRISKVMWLMLPHGIAGALALFLGLPQFSDRLRRRNLRLHRILGRVYVLGVAICAPTAVPIAVILGPPSLIMAAAIQSSGWFLTTAIGLYCVRSGDIRQHREWMIRSYPFAMVFVLARVILAIPAVAALGELALISVVWSLVAAACFVPSLIISWSALFRRRAVKVPAPLVKTDRAAAVG